MRDVQSTKHTETQELDRCWSGTLESPLSDSALPCQPQLSTDTDTDRDRDRDRDLNQNVRVNGDEETAGSGKSHTQSQKRGKRGIQKTLADRSTIVDVTSATQLLFACRSAQTW